MAEVCLSLGCPFDIETKYGSLPIHLAAKGADRAFNEFFLAKTGTDHVKVGFGR